MSNPNSPLEKRRSEALTSSSSSSASQNPSNVDMIYRVANGQTAELGFLYDARTDSVLEKLPFTKLPLSKLVFRHPIACSVTQIDTPEDANVFHMMCMDREQMLSLTLKTDSPNEIDSLINYSLLADKNSRFLYFYYTGEKRKIAGDQNKIKSNLTLTTPQNDATHIIAEIEYGINVAVHLKMPSEQQDIIDSLLQEIKKQFDENLPTFKHNFNSEEKNLLNESIVITVFFSNIPRLTKIPELLNLCQEIMRTKNNPTDCRRLGYRLRPIQWLYPSNISKNTSLKPENMNRIEVYLFRLLHVMKWLKVRFDDVMQKRIGKNLKKKFDEAQHKVIEAEQIWSPEIPRIRDLVLRIRSGVSQKKIMTEMNIDEKERMLQHIKDFFKNHVKPLQEKEELINTLYQHNVEYLNVEDHFPQDYDALKAIEQKLLEKAERKFVICAEDELKKQNPSIWNDLYREWIEGHESNSPVDIIYADFSYCSCHLKKMKILTPDNIEKQQTDISKHLVPSAPDRISSSTPRSARHSSSKDTPLSASSAVASSISTDTISPSGNVSPSASQYTSSSHAKDKRSSASASEQEVISEVISPLKANDPPSSISKSTPPATPEERPPLKKLRPDQSKAATVKFVNVLLLGESGVGKSTFINALANYLAYETFEEANSSKPLVLLPVSFMMTVGDDFKERIVKWGDEDCNEDHDHAGQSVTQYCRSYVFKVGTQTKLRIIDTPGMGDTRGLDQDDLNMQHILSFINNLPHLNAICILLKPNEARLNIVLRSYFTRLLNFLGENVCNNIVFCFTNTRATFFAPGNTGPLLKKMLNDPPINRVPFKKLNTFCFDNESFRYLIAVQNGIPFDDYQKEEYERSWTTSVTESNRLLLYICGELNSYSQNEWQSVEHAQVKITEMIRPLSETMRNILRNITLLKEKSSEKLIKLYPEALSQPSAICYTCERTPIQLSKFWILSDDNLHILSDKCDRCNCSRQKHITVDYRLKYEPFDLTEKEFSYNSVKSNLDQIQEALFEFADFFAYVFHTTSQNDPMLSALKRMVAEENEICTQTDTTYFNSTLRDCLVSVTKDYKERYELSLSYKKNLSLPKVYEAIRNVSEIEMINEQMKIIRKKHMRFMKQHEKQLA